MTSTLRILLTVDPYVPVPPATYGGIERVVAALIAELHARNHDVTLIAHPGSQTEAKQVPYGVAPHGGLGPRSTELWQVGSELWKRRRTVDIVHSFGRLAALLPILALRTMPKVQSYQRQIPWSGVRRALRLADSSLSLTACSAAMWTGHSQAANGRWRTVHNGVDLGLYTPTRDVPPDAPLMFLGRLDRIKGAHAAIEIARRANRRLIVAGNRVDSDEGRQYFAREIEPHIDGRRVDYVGAVDDRAKNALLGTAAALLMPIEWDEPFGIVMVEAMACGTPVIGFDRGSVPEVIDHGVTGMVVRNNDEAVESIELARRLDRARVAARCAQRFSYSVIADAYEQVYREAIEICSREMVVG